MVQEIKLNQIDSVVTTVGTPWTDDNIPTEKAVRDAITAWINYQIIWGATNTIRSSSWIWNVGAYPRDVWNGVSAINWTISLTGTNLTWYWFTFETFVNAVSIWVWAINIPLTIWDTLQIVVSHTGGMNAWLAQLKFDYDYSWFII